MMVSHAYLQVQQLVQQLSPSDQVRLLEYLSCRMASLVALLTSEASPGRFRHTTTWQEFFQVGDDIMRADRPDSQTLTAAVLEMRR